MILDVLVKSPIGPVFVIPAKAGIQLFQWVLDSGFHRSGDSWTFYEFIILQGIRISPSSSKVGLSDPIVFSEALAGSLCHNSALLKGIALIRYLEGLAGVLFCQENGMALALDL